MLLLGQSPTRRAPSWSCGPAAPASLAYETTDPALLTSLLADRETLGVAMAGAAPNGGGTDLLPDGL